MNRLFLILSSIILLNNAFGQTHLVVSSVLKTDRTFHKGNELFLENRATRNQIIFTLDTATKKITSTKYLVETFYSVWDGDSTIKKQIKQRYKSWKHEIPMSKWDNIISSLETDIDTLQKEMGELHTSHHYLNVYIDVINKNDTVSYSNTKPFHYLTPWYSKQLGTILNPSIDIQIAEHLPVKFIGRKELILLLSNF